MFSKSRSRAPRRRGRFLAIAAAVAVALTGCTTGGGGDSSASSTLTIAIGAAPPSLALPTNCSGPEYSLAYEPLIRVGADGQYAPGIAKSWEYSENNTVFTMQIRQGVKFADGTDLTAQSVVDTLNYYKETPGINQGYVTPLTVTAPSDDVVEISYAEPFIGMETLLAADGECNNGLIISEAGLDDPEAMKNATFGAGPYVLDTAQTVTGDRYTYTPNPHYFDESRQAWEKIVLKVISDPNTAFNALATGQVQVDMTGGANLVKEVESKGLDVTKGLTLGVGIMLYDREGVLVPALAEQGVRQAIAYALNRDEIATALGPTVDPFNQFAIPGLTGYDESIGYDTDLDKAKELMAEAGYADGFELTVLTSSTDPAGLTATQAITSQLAEIGITVTVKQPPAGQEYPELATKQYPAGIWSYTLLGDTYFDAVRLYKAPYSDTWNPFRSTDPDLDAAYNALATAPPDQVEALSVEFNNVMTEKAWFIPIALTYNYVFSKGIEIGTTSQIGQFDYASWVPKK